MTHALLFLALAPLAAAAKVAPPAKAPVATPPPSPVRAALEAELARTMSDLATKPVPPYYLAYAVYDVAGVRIQTGFGALTDEGEHRQRLLTIDLRVGDYAFDSTHRVRGESAHRAWYTGAVELPLDDEVAALRAVVWRETDRRYRQAVEQLAKVKTNREVKVEEEDKSGDLSREDPVTDLRGAAGDGLPALDRDAWKARLRRASAVFATDPLVLDGDARLQVDATRRTLVTSEGTRIETAERGARVVLSAATKAADGMDLPRAETWFAWTPDGLPSEEALVQAATRIVADLAALRAAPKLDPYTGPAILSGRAAGVFFHEIFGHRIEGQRQKGEEEGQTFKKMIGQPVLPEFLSVVFDPTRRTIGTTPAAGYYAYDDEGVAARAVRAVDHGVLKTFLLSRAPVTGFPKSNGHGRCQPGRPPVGRQSNLVVEASATVPHARLREMLVEEVKKQDKPFGLFFEDIAGGFTLTGRTMPNSFAVQPILVWKVWPDGKPDELVRGADLIGTPLTTFAKIQAAGDDLQTFNGVCGAESGWVPVSASSPSLLVTTIEVQKKEKSEDRPPLLPAPSVEVSR